MTFIHLYEDSCRLKEYSALTKGGKSIVTVKIECISPRHLGYLLADLEEIERKQKAEKTAKQEARRSKAKTVLALPAPALQLPYYGDGGGE
ncbi:MAG: hypothetical protein DI537_20680 [Stutzerimonas stutzeri]|nr:MAG: hypothetical protein DI537_20680 [Stutzerimonas stutzeri]